MRVASEYTKKPLQELISHLMHSERLNGGKTSVYELIFTHKENCNLNKVLIESLWFQGLFLRNLGFFDDDDEFR